MSKSNHQSTNSGIDQAFKKIPGTDARELGRYRYEPITKSGVIRVLDLDTNTKDSLECSITQIKISEHRYQALSYEWGSEEKPFRILVYAKKSPRRRSFRKTRSRRALGYISLTMNLHNALKDLRDTVGIPSKRFWIDQISINQDDDEEKGHQVQLMADIYRHASQVITYLGPHSQNMVEETEALDLLMRIDKRFRPIYSEIPPIIDEYNALNYSILKNVISKLSGGFNLESPYWSALLSIVCSGWIRRLWMVQENLLCPKAYMLRGTRRLDWLSVGFVLMFPTPEIYADSVQDIATGFIEDINLDVLWMPIWEQWKSRLRYDTNGQRTLEPPSRNLLQDLFNFADLECRDTRDHIFALLGLSSPEHQLGILPDYTRPPAEIFINFSIRVYHRLRDVWLLENLSSLDRHPDPTIPSWSYCPAKHLEAGPNVGCPHPSLVTDVSFESNDSTMVVKGQVVDSVRSIFAWADHSTIVNKEQYDKRTRWTVAILLTCATYLEEVGFTLETVTMLVRAITTDQGWPDSADPSKATFYLWCYFMTATNYYAVQSRPSIRDNHSAYNKLLFTLKSLCKLLERADIEVYDDPLRDMEPDHQAIAEEVNSLAKVLRRSFSVSEHNRVCNVTHRAKEGDVIAILAGGHRAFVLRPVGENYQYVGTAWVDGIMNGELYKDVSPEEVDYEIRLV